MSLAGGARAAPTRGRGALAVAALAVTALAAAPGCQTGRMHQGTLEVGGPGTDAERLERAKRVATRCYGEGALRGAITQRFSTVQEADLVGMFIHWAPATLDQSGRRGVVVQYGVREVGDRVPAPAVLAFIHERCAAVLAEELTAAPAVASGAPSAAAPSAAPGAPSAAAPSAAPGAPSAAPGAPTLASPSASGVAP